MTQAFNDGAIKIAAMGAILPPIQFFSRLVVAFSSPENGHAASAERVQRLDLTRVIQTVSDAEVQPSQQRVVAQ